MNGAIETLGPLPRRRPAGDEDNGQVRIGRPGGARDLKAIGARAQVDVRHQSGQFGVAANRLEGGGGAVDPDSIKAAILQCFTAREV